MIASITMESINKYDKAAELLQTLQEKDISFALSYLRLKFNDTFSYNNQYYTPLFESAQQSFKTLLDYIKDMETRKTKDNFFNYDRKLIKYIIKLYEARICSLLN